MKQNFWAVLSITDHDGTELVTTRQELPDMAGIFGSLTCYSLLEPRLLDLSIRIAELLVSRGIGLRGPEWHDNDGEVG